MVRSTNSRMTRCRYLQYIDIAKFRKDKCCGTATFFEWPLILPACRMGLNFSGFSVKYNSVGLPSGFSGLKTFIRVGNSAVVVFLEFVLDGVRGVAAKPIAR